MEIILVVLPDWEEVDPKMKDHENPETEDISPAVWQKYFLTLIGKKVKRAYVSSSDFISIVLE